MLIRIWIGSGESFALFALRVFVDHCRLLVCECGCFHHRQHHTTVVAALHYFVGSLNCN
uniref:Secreted protein n=1 Tax=Ascaris lumbricoides TaxID=6252 RepID=A0A0M3IV18_ASCLU